MTCLEQNQLSEAQKLHEQAIEGFTKTLGAEHEDSSNAVDNLGLVMSAYSRFEDAKDLLSMHSTD